MPDELLDRLRAADPLAGDPTRVVPPSLEALGFTSERLEAARSEGGTASAWSPSAAAAAKRQRAPWRASGLSVVIALLVGTGTAAASLTALTGDPLGRAPKLDIEPSAATVRIAQSRAADPDGGPNWAIRLGRADGGLTCVAVGQVHGDQLGLVGLDGVFRADRPRDADDCAVVSRPESMLVQGRTFLGRTSKTAVSVIYGVVGRNTDRIYVEYPDVPIAAGPTSIPIARDRSFVFAQRGTLSERKPRFSALAKTPRGARYVAMTTIEFGRPWTQRQIWSRQRAARPTMPGGSR